MDDLISRKAAIDEIDEWIKAFRENGHKESAADACLIQDGIIQLPSAQPEQQWIPVTERLPEKRKWVLCFCQANIIDVLRFENAEWYHDPTHVYMFEFVTHWMPLPGPPKEET